MSKPQQDSFEPEQALDELQQLVPRAPISRVDVRPATETDPATNKLPANIEFEAGKRDESARAADAPAESSAEKHDAEEDSGQARQPGVSVIPPAD